MVTGRGVLGSITGYTFPGITSEWKKMIVLRSFFSVGLTHSLFCICTNQSGKSEKVREYGLILEVVGMGYTQWLVMETIMKVCKRC